jgi:hypothetical protein
VKKVFQLTYISELKLMMMMMMMTMVNKRQRTFWSLENTAMWKK